MITADIILIILGLLFSIALYIIAGFAVKIITPNWKIVYAVPFLISIIIAAIYGFEISMLGVYIGTAVFLAGFVKDDLRIRRIACIVGAVCTVISIPVCLLNNDYRTVSFVDDFNAGFKKMKKYYILAEHKGIDWDEVYNNSLPLFEKADETHDEVDNYIAWLYFTKQFRDGHVGYAPHKNYDDIHEKALRRIAGNDYGLSMMTCADGRIAAVNVEENSVLTDAGIHNGTIITLWNGKSPEDAAEDSELFKVMPYSDKDNEAFFRALHAAGTGGDTVDISYLDDNGQEQNITLSKLGDYYDRYKETYDTVNQGLEAGHMSWTEINENTACLRIKMMQYDSNASYDRMKISIVAALKEYRERGFTNIVIDLRNNGGGSGEMVQVISEVFSPKGAHFYFTDGLWDGDNNCFATDPETGKYLPGHENYFVGDDLWSDNQVVILVNTDSASAADHLPYVLMGHDNITVMGFTESNGSAQGVSSVGLEVGSLGFSSSLVLDSNGDIAIDAGTDYESGNDIEIRVPFDEEAVSALFDKNEDHLMNKAVEYFDSVK